MGNKKVNYTILSKEFSRGEIVVKLNYEDPQKISTSSDPDFIQVTLFEDIKVEGEGWITILKQKPVKKAIPPQLVQSIIKFSITKYRSRKDFLDNEGWQSRGGRELRTQLRNVRFDINHIYSTIAIQYVWNCLDDLSFMLINTMISMPVPGIVQMVQTVLLNFIYLDILLTDFWVPMIF